MEVAAVVVDVEVTVAVVVVSLALDFLVRRVNAACSSGHIILHLSCSLIWRLLQIIRRRDRYLSVQFEINSASSAQGCLFAPYTYITDRSSNMNCRPLVPFFTRSHFFVGSRVPATT